MARFLGDAFWVSSLFRVSERTLEAYINPVRPNLTGRFF